MNSIRMDQRLLILSGVIIFILCRFVYADIGVPTPVPPPVCTASSTDIQPKLLIKKDTGDFLELGNTLILGEGEPKEVTFRFDWNAYSGCPRNFHSECTTVVWTVQYPSGEIREIRGLAGGNYSDLLFIFSQDGPYQICAEHSGWQACDPEQPGPISSTCKTIVVDTNQGDIPPVADNVYLNVIQETQTNVTCSASDEDGTIAEYIIITQPEHGEVSNLDSQSGAFTYTPLDGYVGIDTFGYIAYDNDLIKSNIATIVLYVWEGVGNEPELTISGTPQPTLDNTTNINTTVNFPDPFFRKAMEAFMGVPPGGTFTEMDAATKTASGAHFTWIDIRIRNLEGIQYFKKLRSVQFNSSLVIYLHND